MPKKKRSTRIKKSYSKKNKSKNRKRTYRKRGGMNEWQGEDFPPGSNLSKQLNESMGIQNPSFQEQQPYGPLTECQSLECKKRRAEIALERAKEELERLTNELNDARDRERMNQILIPLQNAYNEITTMTTNVASYSVKKLRKERDKLGIKGKKAIGKAAAKTAKYAAAIASKNLPLTPENRSGLLDFQRSAERFDRSLGN